MDTYKITLLEYAQVKGFPATSVFSLGCSNPDDVYPVTYIITLLQSDTQNILIDCGYDINNPEAFSHMKSEHHINYSSPADIIKKANVCPEEIDAVILSHAHWDHMGGIDFFPNATFYLQKQELLMWKEVFSLPQEFNILKSAVKASDLKRCCKLLEEGRLVLIDGNKKDLFCGIDIIVATEGHSFACNMVLVNTDVGKYLFTGDVAYMRENITGINNDGILRPNGYSIGSVYNSVKALNNIREILRGDLTKAVICHDAKIWSQFNSHISSMDNLHVAQIG